MHIWSDNHAVRYTDANALFTIADDDPVPTVQIADAPTVTEGGNLSFPLTLSNPTVDAVTVGVDPAANAGLDQEAGNTSLNWDANDYTGIAATSVTFQPLQTALPYPFHTIDDGVFESTEQVSLQLTGATNALLPAADQRSALGVVQDNTPMPTLTIESPGNVMWWQPMNFPITLSGPSQLRVHLSVDAVVANWRGENLHRGNVWTYDEYFGFELDPMQTTADLMTLPPSDPSVSTLVSVWSVAYSFVQNDESRDRNQRRQRLGLGIQGRTAPMTRCRRRGNRRSFELRFCCVPFFRPTSLKEVTRDEMDRFDCVADGHACCRSGCFDGSLVVVAVEGA